MLTPRIAWSTNIDIFQPSNFWRFFNWICSHLSSFGNRGLFLEWKMPLMKGCNFDPERTTCTTNLGSSQGLTWAIFPPPDFPDTFYSFTSVSALMTILHAILQTNGIINFQNNCSVSLSPSWFLKKFSFYIFNYPMTNTGIKWSKISQCDQCSLISWLHCRVISTEMRQVTVPEGEPALGRAPAVQSWNSPRTRLIIDFN